MRHSSAFEELLHPDADDAGLAPAVLARPVYVREPQGGHDERGSVRKAEEVLLAGQLRDAVGRDRIRGVILVRRETLRVAVDRAPAGREDDLGDTGRERRLRDADRAEDVDLRVEDGILDGLSHVDLRRIMEDRVHVRGVEEAFEVEAPDVAFDESGPFREAGPLAR